VAESGKGHYKVIMIGSGPGGASAPQRLANPTLTIIANALRVADAIAARPGVSVAL
jgi:choline dehydrogenase-like flavoprotein